jgi:hypothetical protein
LNGRQEMLFERIDGWLFIVWSRNWLTDSFLIIFLGWIGGDNAAKPRYIKNYQHLG